MGMMHHRLAQKRDMAIFWWNRQYFCLQKAGWLVCMKVRVYILLRYQVVETCMPWNSYMSCTTESVSVHGA